MLCATTALAHGVNLPARRVIIKDSYKSFDSVDNRITATEYKQMSGRAGRAGIDTQGESILMVRPNGSNRQQLQALMQVGWQRLSECAGRCLAVSQAALTQWPV